MVVLVASYSLSLPLSIATHCLLVPIGTTHSITLVTLLLILSIGIKGTLFSHYVHGYLCVIIFDCFIFCSNVYYIYVHVLTSDGEAMHHQCLVCFI